ncbi:MAG: proton extrusion protein PcxA [Jaaginema sp. PMC 1079.18]|nr:proton extrusion protein PcxA [Jaaginema sp. PMC 1080.18]MEC4850954.1 proton extrusion protein PcxA [Jaaginema sp. PMC 1079.18]MEC4867769.1 proton extrusion protein PcxA [Jaaginema sp. PMC 1078.18]
MKLKKLYNSAKRWFFDTPERALDQAYRAALMIRAIEDEYFNGQKVSRDNSEYSSSVFNYCEAEVQKNLKTIRLRLTEFNSTRTWVDISENKPIYPAIDAPEYEVELREKSAIAIEKINFIDEVVNRYKPVKSQDKTNVSLVELSQRDRVNPQALQSARARSLPSSKVDLNKNKKAVVERNGEQINVETVTDKTGVLPRSILNTFRKLKREIDPTSSDSEAEVLKKFRQSRNRTAISVRFLLLLIIVPLLTHQLSKNFLIMPLIEKSVFQETQELIFLNEDMQEEALIELKNFEEALHFKALLGLSAELNNEEREEAVIEKADEIAEHYRHRGVDAIANVFADICSLIAFTIVIFLSRRDIIMLKSFLDEIIYGLSDSAKSFLIILFTDMFVGFHSPHGWEVILEGISRHFGLPESRDFNFLFIATFPVILDTVLKYWIFRYLNRISPSAVATYKTMNE